MPKIAREWPVALMLALLSVSCTHDDRVVVVSCDGASGGPNTVATELASHGERVSSIGYLNSQGLPLGTIVRLVPGSTRPADLLPWRAVALSASDLLPATPIVLATTLGDGLQARLDDDIRTVARRAGIDMDRAILKHTALYIDGPVVLSLRDAASAINRDPELVRSIHTDANARFAIVSRTIEGEDLAVFNGDAQSVSANTFEIGEWYVHLSYSCPALELLARRARSYGATPVVFYLSPIRYDEATAKVATDPRPLEGRQSQ